MLGSCPACGPACPTWVTNASPGDGSGSHKRIPDRAAGRLGSVRLAPIRPSIAVRCRGSGLEIEAGIQIRVVARVFGCPAGRLKRRPEEVERAFFGGEDAQPGGAGLVAARDE